MQGRLKIWRKLNNALDLFNTMTWLNEIWLDDRPKHWLAIYLIKGNLDNMKIRTIFRQAQAWQFSMSDFRGKKNL